MKKVITLLVVLVIGSMGLWYLSSNNAANTGSLTAQVQTTQTSNAKDIYNLLQEMNTAKLDNSIFYNSVFTSLKDNTVTLTAPPSGRSNPFAPVGSLGTVSSGQ